MLLPLAPDQGYDVAGLRQSGSAIRACPNRIGPSTRSKVTAAHLEPQGVDCPFETIDRGICLIIDSLLLHLTKRDNKVNYAPF